ncbi:cytochrome c-type biogenesis protein CcsB [Branchiibius hedensis]|uniref:Cytochrome c-type biogenesis protein CcsB n=1 Tax=Branchiibius hedensis TaxID=672460 RepID=A0A2Y8ZSF9_9MICO|nr:c-type cytochrome biogenesis protein CcsB [Branchiibius hedensis]PWJ24039.1 cytochrome c-type biogenesis protein CcsB [Branchiibius hedensis]SSA32857.1 cytochrome c-type biogenesis protein CcsB [Branchiibius hedensis]
MTVATLVPALATAIGNGETNESFSSISTNLLWSSALVLTLAMLAFGVDLAGHPARAERAATRRTSGAVASAEGSSDTAVLTAAPVEEEVPEKRQWAGIGMSLTYLGTLLLAGCIVFRSLSVQRPPLGNMYEFALVATLFMLVAFSIWSIKRDIRWLGMFVTLIAILLEMAAALVFYTAASQLMPSLQSYWLSIHVTVATLSIGLFTLAFVVQLLYLVQARRESRERTGGFLDALPNSTTLDRLAYGIVIIAFPLWTFTLIAGAIWAQKAWGHYWNWDPKEVWTLVIWVMYAAYLHARYTAGWSGKKAAYLALAAYACIIINYGIVNVYFVGQHSYSGM